MSIAFNEIIRKNNPIFTALSNSTLSKDPSAPINIIKKDLAKFKKRKDMRGIRASIKAAKSRGTQDRKIFHTPLI
jgi:hypothetical protein